MKKKIDISRIVINREKVTLIFLWSLFFIFLLAPVALAQSNFPDPNLEAKIREALNIPTGTIYNTDLEKLTVLDANNSSITDITGLEYCTNLEDLRLYNNQISDISELSGLTNLTLLWLASNQISDISSLVGLINLEDLRLYNNQISDISPLVENSGVNSGDTVDITYNSLTCDSTVNEIPVLIARGVNLTWDGYSDGDSDGIIDCDDNCPDQANPNQEDADNDTIGDVCDNCPTVVNPLQKNSDNDDSGDICDNDTISGFVLGDIEGDVNVSLYRPSCGVPTLLNTKKTGLNGYYAFGNLNNGAYMIAPYHFSYSFIPEKKGTLIPQAEIRSFDFTAIED